jgi:AP-3 complex subunit delta-1
MEKIVLICSQNDYQFITNFEWYISVLVELTRMEGTNHGPLLASQMMDVAIRVESIREFAVSQMALLLENYHLLIGSGQSNSASEVLYAAAWICGEFSLHVANPKETLQFMFSGRVSSLPGHIQVSPTYNIAH